MPKNNSSILHISVRDPGEDLTQTGNKVAVATKGLTKMAAALTAGERGSDIDGYRDYRGVPVVGAWKWLPDLDFGVASEIDVAEAFRPLYTLRTIFFSLLGILAIHQALSFGNCQKKPINCPQCPARPGHR